MASALVVDDSATERCLAGHILDTGTDLTVLYARDGAEALDVIERDAPAVVVTDLQMPHMDGLTLVGEIRSKYPFVPVILMTAFGSEDIAVKALKAGATSYVPKENLKEDLADTVKRVLEIAEPHRRNQVLLKGLSNMELNFVLGNEPDTTRLLISHLQEPLVPMGLCDESGGMRVAMALGEAIRNAVCHGNLELSSDLRRDTGAVYEQLAEERLTQSPYCDRKIHVTAKVSPDEAVYVIRDEGNGFDSTALPDPNDPVNLEKLCGRGVMLMRAFMDDVSFNGKGTEVTMVKRRQESTADQS